MAHVLGLKIDDVTENVNAILVSDISIYDTNLSVTTPQLAVMIPDSIVYHSLTFANGNKLISFDHTALGLSTDNIPDGAYYFKYSVSPNNTTYIIVLHFRMISLYNTVLEAMSKFCHDHVCDEYLQLLQIYIILRCIPYNAEIGNYDRCVEFYTRCVYLFNSLNFK